VIAVVGLHAQALRVGVQIGGILDVGAQVQRQARRQRVAALERRQATRQRFRHDRQGRRIVRRQRRRQFPAVTGTDGMAAGPIPGHAQHGHRRQHEQPGFQGRSKGHRRQ
jgi:hypothetical protein